MPKDAFWFHHDSNASHDYKIRAAKRYYYRLVEEMLETGNIDKTLVLALVAAGAVGWYWQLIEDLREQDEYCLEYSEYVFDSLSVPFLCKPSHVKDYIDRSIDTFKHRGKGLFEKNDDTFHSDRLTRDMTNWEERKEKRSEAGKAGARSRWPESRTEQGNIIGQMIDLYEQKTGHTLTPNNLEHLKDMAESYSFQDFEDAVGQAVNRKAKSPIPYIAKILEGNVKEQPEPKDGMEGMTEDD